VATATRRRNRPPPDEVTDGTVPAEGDASEVNGSGPMPTETNGTGDEPRKPAHVLSYLVARDTYVQASIWQRTVTLADGTAFTAHDVSLRKRCKNASGDWQSYYSFRGSELYAVAHAVSQANAWILETRAANDCPF
jgi:hypothetical protein